MEKITIEFTQKEFNNLAYFLGKSRLKGVEVGSYNEIVTAMNRPFLEKLPTQPNSDTEKPKE